MYFSLNVQSRSNPFLEPTNTKHTGKVSYSRKQWGRGGAFDVCHNCKRLHFVNVLYLKQCSRASIQKIQTKIKDKIGYLTSLINIPHTDELHLYMSC